MAVILKASQGFMGSITAISMIFGMKTQGVGSLQKANVVYPFDLK